MLITVDVMPAQMKLPFHVITDLETKPVGVWWCCTSEDQGFGNHM